MVKVLKTPMEFVGTREMSYGGKITGPVSVFNHNGKLYTNEGVVIIGLAYAKKLAEEGEIICPAPSRKGKAWHIMRPFKGKIKSKRKL